MRPVFRSIQILTSFLCIQVLSGLAVAGELTVDVGRGAVRVIIPESYDPGTPTPVIVILHGYGSEPERADDIFHLSDRVDEYGFLLVMARGSKDVSGANFWNATAACCNITGNPVDDSTYLLDLIEEVETVFNVDNRRIYLAGTSNGGFMGYRMANDHADKIAAVVSLGGASFTATEGFVSTGPVHVLEVHGTEDQVVRYTGGVLVGPYPSAVTSVERWANINGCDVVIDGSAAPLDLDDTLPGAETIVTRYSTACNSGGSAELWTVVGGHHVPLFREDFSRHLIDFLYAHHKPEVGVSHCFGDGSERPCPCGNDSPRAGEGCLHSGNRGMRITGSGTNSIAAADLSLTALSVPEMNAGLFYAGTIVKNPVVPLFDGLQCAGGDMRRFRSFFQENGRATDTNFGQQVPGYFAPGATFHFQFWTRDALARSSPCGWNANFSPAYAVTMVP